MQTALVLIGAPGSGKSSTLDALCTKLEIEGIAHGAIESEQLSRGSPLLRGAEWTAQLAAVLALQRAHRRRILIAATTETAQELRQVIDATAAERLLVVCLSAPAQTLAARLDAREPDRWPGKQGLIAHALELAEVIPKLEGIDLVIDTGGRGPLEVAEEVYREMLARSLL